MGKWVPESTTIVASMSNEDFHSNEKYVGIDENVVVHIEFVAENETVNVRKEKASLHSRRGAQCYVYEMHSLERILRHTE